MDPPDSVIPVELSNIAEIVEVVSIVPVTEEEVRAFNDLAWEIIDRIAENKEVRKEA